MRFMAAESITSPALEASTSIPMAVQSLSEFMLLLVSALGEWSCESAFCLRRVSVVSSEGPRATRPTPQVISRTPAHRHGTDGFMQEKTGRKAVTT